MKRQTQMLSCADCRRQFPVSVITQLDLRFAEDRAVSLSDGSLFSFVCPHCKHSTGANHFLLYFDPAHQIALCNVTNAQEKAEFDRAIDRLSAQGNLRNIARRVVFSPARLCEKAMIFSHGMDDRVIELLKVHFVGQVREQFPGETFTDVLFYPDGTGGSFVFLSASVDRSVSFTLEQYRQAEALFRFPEPSPAVIDAAWAMGRFADSLNDKSSKQNL